MAAFAPAIDFKPVVKTTAVLIALLTASQKLLQQKGSPRLCGIGASYLSFFASIPCVWQWMKLGIFALLTFCVRLRTWLLAKTRIDNYQTRVSARLIAPLTDSPTQQSGNEHQLDADARAHATVQINAFCAAIDANPFYMQMAACDQRRDRAGSLNPLWGKDLVAEPRAVPLGPRDVAVFVDVDYYLDLNNTLLECMRRQDKKTVVFYTLIPEVAASSGASSFTFSDDGALNQITAGGSRFKHELWDHGRDIVLAQDAGMCAFFNVERQRIAPNRYVVVYSAFAVTQNFVQAMLMRVLEGPPAAKRLSPVKAGWTTLTVMSAEGMDFSVAKCGEFVAASVSPKIVSSLKAHRSALVQATLMNAYDMDRYSASVLVRWADAGYPFSFQEVQAATRLRSVPNVVQHYHSIEDDSDKAKTAMRQIASPPYPDITFVPMKTPGNMDRAVWTRAVAPQLEHYTPTSGTTRFVTDYVEEMSKRQPRGQHPWGPEQVEQVQNSAQQRRLFAEACATSPQDSPHRIIDSFQKGEAYEKLADPRIISPQQTDEKRDLACFIYAIAYHYKTLEWFSAGKTPRAVASRVTEIAMSSEFVTEGDDSRRDGRWRAIVHAALRLLLQNFFHARYHNEINRLMDRQAGRVGRAGTFLYQTMWSLLSGSAITSFGNTWLSHMEASYGFVLAGRTVAQAVDLASAKGVYGGDDSLVGDLDPDCFTEAVRLLGQSGKTILRARGQYVTFLGRFYGPGVWRGQPDSMRDVLRALRSICVAKHSCTPDDAKFVEKVKALALSDRNTPILRFIVEAVERLVGFDKVVDSGEVYCLRFAETEQSPNSPGDWMEELVPGDADWKLLAEHCRNATSIASLRQFPSVKEALSVEPVVLTPPNPKPDIAAMEAAAASAPLPSKDKQPAARGPAGPARGADAKKYPCLQFNTTRGCTREGCRFEHVKLTPEEYKTQLAEMKARSPLRQ